MVQLQAAMLKQLDKHADGERSPETVKPGTQALPPLKEVTAETACVDIMDWLEMIDGPMSDLSDSSATWWRKVMMEANRAYGVWSLASPMDKLSVEPSVLDLEDGKVTRLNSRAAAMIVNALHEGVRQEVVARRLAGSTVRLVFRLLTLYQPGGEDEKFKILQNLQSPPLEHDPARAVTALRSWSRWLRRCRELGVQTPDPSLLARGLNNLVKAVLEKSQDASFRTALVKSTLQVDTNPSYDKIDSYFKHLVAECEALAVATTPTTNAPNANGRPEPKLRPMRTDARTQNGQQPTTTPRPPSPSPTTTSNEDGNKSGTPKSEVPCRFFGKTNKGCIRTSKCPFKHSWEGLDKRDRCMNCGGKGHPSKECPAKKSPQNPNGSSGRDNKDKPSSSTTTPATKTVKIDEKPEVSPIPSRTEEGPSASDLKDVLADVGKMLKVMQATSLKAIRVKCSDYPEDLPDVKEGSQKKAGVVCEEVGTSMPETAPTPEDKPDGLLDSGASHPMRPASESEYGQGSPVSVTLAGEDVKVLRQNNQGTILVKENQGPIQSIVPLGAVIQELGYTLHWSPTQLKLTHPVRGPIRVKIHNNCPEVAACDALAMIRELELKQVQTLNSQVETLRARLEVLKKEDDRDWCELMKEYKGCGKRSVLLKALLKCPFTKTLPYEIQSMLLEDFDLDAGLDYMKVLPFTRKRRKALMNSQSWVVCFYLGELEKSDPLKMVSVGGKTLLEVDMKSSKLWDINAASGIYRLLLWAAAKGKITDILLSMPDRSWPTSQTPTRGEGSLPMRTNQAPYGRKDLLPHQQQQVWTETACAVKPMLLWTIATMANKGNVGYMMEMHSDPEWLHGGDSPFATWWKSETWKAFKSVSGMRQSSFYMGGMGHAAKRPTTVGTNYLMINQNDGNYEFGDGCDYKGTKEKKWDASGARWKKGWYRGPSTDVSKGHLILREDGGLTIAKSVKFNVIDPEKDLRYLLPPATAQGVSLSDGEDDEPQTKRQLAEEIEFLARKLLDEENFSLEEVLGLYNKLEELGDTDMRIGKKEAVTSWYTGAFVHGGCAGIRRNSYVYPQTTKYLVRVAKHYAQGESFSALGIARNATLGLHRDVHNFKKSNNVVVPITSFKGGSLWKWDPDVLEDQSVQKELPNGQVVKGSIHEMVKGVPVKFAPGQWHEVQPWEGDRVVLLLYTPRASKLTDKDVERLEDMGFPVNHESLKRETDEADEESVEIEEEIRVKTLHVDPLSPTMAFVELDDSDIFDGKRAPTTTHGGEARKTLKKAEVQYTPNIVKKNIDKWKASAIKEFTNLKDAKNAFVIKKKHELPPGCRIVPCKGVYTVKPDKNSLFRRKTRFVACGNHVPEGQEGMDLFATGLDATTLRTMLAYTIGKPWKYGTTDIRQAFVLAPWLGLPVALQPPAIAYELGLAEPGDYWFVTMSIYGLRESPALWSRFRDEQLRMARWFAEVEGQMEELKLVQMITDDQVWKIVRANGDQEPLGYLMVYIDDLLINALPTVMDTFFGWVASKWECDNLDVLEVDHPIRFLGMEFHLVDEGVELAQEGFVRELLRSHGHDGSRSKTPGAKETVVLTLEEEEAMILAQPVDLEGKEDQVKAAQRVVGELLWLTGRTRPDLQYYTALLSSRITRCPEIVNQVANRVLNYLAETLHYRIRFSKNEENTEALHVFTASSFAPSSGRSHGSAAVFYGDNPIAWRSSRQSLVTLSTAESEPLSLYLHIDNQSAVMLLQGSSGSWRTRHLRLRSNFVKEKIQHKELQVVFEPGISQRADLGTKPLPKDRMAQLLRLWNVVDRRPEVQPTIRAMATNNSWLMRLLMLCQVCGVRSESGQLQTEIPWDLYVAVLVIAIVVIFLWETSKSCTRGSDVRLRALRARAGYGKMSRNELKELQRLLALEPSDLSDAQGVRLLYLRDLFETTMPSGTSPEAELIKGVRVRFLEAGQDRTIDSKAQYPKAIEVTGMSAQASVFDLRKKIAAMEDMPLEDINLFAAESVLSDEVVLHEVYMDWMGSGIDDWPPRFIVKPRVKGFEIHVLVKPMRDTSDWDKGRLMSYQEQTLIFDVMPTTKVKDLKFLIAGRIGIPASRHQLSAHIRRSLHNLGEYIDLDDDEKTLADYELDKYCVCIRFEKAQFDANGDYIFDDAFYDEKGYHPQPAGCWIPQDSIADRRRPDANTVDPNQPLSIVSDRRAAERG
ncbi:RE2 [Symbiodinium sp. CCMP2592]|nr:RE2 [Symbiodinium sp. CCMP2592]